MAPWLFRLFLVRFFFELLPTPSAKVTNKKKRSYWTAISWRRDMARRLFVAAQEKTIIYKLGL